MHKATSTPTVLNQANHPVSSIPNETYYTLSLGKQAGTMGIIIKYHVDSRQWRFVDISAGITFLINPDTNTINFPQHAHDKAIELFSYELQKFVSQRFPYGCEKDSHTTITLEQDNNQKLIGDTHMETTSTYSTTNNLPQVFTFESDKQIRTITKDNDILFVAKDVAEALEYSWKGIATIQHVPDIWRGVYSVQTPSGIQEMLSLTEQGLYFFINRSDKPKALPFQMWLAGEVLPSIRKTGSYSTNYSGIDLTTESLIRLEERLITRFEQMVESLKPKHTRKPKKVTAQESAQISLFENQKSLKTLYNQHLALMEKVIAWGATTGFPFTKTGVKGIYDNRIRLPKPFNTLACNYLELLVQELLNTGRIKKYSVYGSGTAAAQWLDVPNGVLSKGDAIVIKGSRTKAPIYKGI